MKTPDFLNRYTTLPILLDVLVQKRITLLSPALWEDRNDAYCIEQYKLAKKCKTVLGLCFSSARETFHHWKVFSSGGSGVCIEFDRKNLLANVPEKGGFRHDFVEYKTIQKIENDSVELNRVPFLKRWAYRDEKEYRIIYESYGEDAETKDLPIKLGAIRKVTLSPWIPRSVFKTVSEVIHSLAGCGDLSVNRSSLIENSKWKTAISEHCLSAKKHSTR